MAGERYQRQTVLKGFGETAQARLGTAKVLVIGAGGIGCPALQYLAAAGIGYLGVVDDDTIELSNLHRQILYTTADVGKQKAEIASLRLRAMNPEISVYALPVRLDRNNVFDVLGSYDYILDGSDNFETRYIVNDACVKLNKPLIFAAVSGYEGQLAIFNAVDDIGDATNYRDLFPIPPTPGEIPNCEENGVLGVLPGIVGTMAAAEVIKLITGIGKPLINTLLHHNLLTNAQYSIRITKGTGYQFEDFEQSNPTYLDITGAELKGMLHQPDTLLIDVREAHEQPRLEAATYKQVPMSAFEEYLHTEINEKNIVLLCQHGIRSVAAAEALLDKYGSAKNIYSLKGGIVKWRNYL